MIYIDDGLKETFKYAFPILKKYNIKAVWALCPNLIGKIRHDKERMSWEDIKNLVSDGQFIASHTLNHIKMKGFAESKSEIIESKEILGKTLGIKIERFVYPYDFQPSKEIQELVNKTYSDIRKFNKFAFHLISPKTIKFYEWFHTPEFFEEYVKNETKN